jgi:hypothetical protein
MAVTKIDLQGIITKIENGESISYFFLPDFEKESGGMKLAYDHVKAMNENGFNAKVLHQKEGYFPKWLEAYYDLNEDGTFKDIPIVYSEGDEPLAIGMEDFFFIPEGFPQVMENLAKQNAPCKKIIFCQNWYYVLNSLPPGVFWDSYGITDVMSVSNSQSEYLKLIMPFLKIKNVIGNIDSEVFSPPETMTDKKLVVSFIPSRDNGVKSYNVIKTFYAIFPHFRFIRFAELKGMSKDDYVKALRESAFYAHFDEQSSWGTAPIEAFNCKCLVAGWDGVGGREYMNTDNMWIVPNGDIIRLAMAIGNMIETYIVDEVPDKIWEEMEKATMMYSKVEEKDSIIRTHGEYRDERIKELSAIESRLEDTKEDDSE